MGVHVTPGTSAFARGVRETAGPTNLAMAAVADLSIFRRNGLTVEGVTVAALAALLAAAAPSTVGAVTVLSRQRGATTSLSFAVPAGAGGLAAVGQVLEVDVAGECGGGETVQLEVFGTTFGFVATNSTRFVGRARIYRIDGGNSAVDVELHGSDELELLIASQNVAAISGNVTLTAGLTTPVARTLDVTRFGAP